MTPRNVNLAPVVTPRNIALAIAALTFLVFLPSLWFDFLYLDDDLYVFENPVVLSGLTWPGIAWAFTTVHAGYWLPLTWISYMVDASLLGTGPFGFHLTNNLLHAANAALVFLVFRRYTGATAASAMLALGFALHPLRVESVTWIAERKDVLSGLFWLLALWSYHDYAHRPTPRNFVHVTAWMILGLLSKPVLVTLPLVLLLLDYWPLRRHANHPPRRAIWILLREKIPLFTLSLGAGLITLLTQSSEGAITRSAEPVLWILRWAAVPANYLFYLEKLLWPSQLTALYTPQLPSILGMLLAAAVLLSITLAAIRHRERHPHLAVGWFWFLMVLLPTSGFLGVGAAVRADRFTYLPSIGFGLALIWSVRAYLDERPQSTRLITLLALLLLGAYTTTTLNYQRYWKDNPTFFTRILNINPHFLAHANIGSYFIQQQQWDEAEMHLTTSLALAPSYLDGYVTLAGIYHHQGKLEIARSMLENVLAQNPNHILAHNNLGNILSDLGNHRAAILSYRNALERNPRYTLAAFNLGNAHLALGELESALQAYLHAVEASPDFILALHQAAVCYYHLGRLQEARTMTLRTLSLSPQLPEALALLSAIQSGVSP
ncbi:MAG TPA: tetratricopeptide repeat protein [Kiritimatiellia bacterium]|nr:tetratricopeptide repeat protein [Kiritimatiellia bacterium]